MQCTTLHEIDFGSVRLCCDWLQQKARAGSVWVSQPACPQTAGFYIDRSLMF